MRARAWGGGSHVNCVRDPLAVVATGASNFFTPTAAERRGTAALKPIQASHLPAPHRGSAWVRLQDAGERQDLVRYRVRRR
jgi:hypothetical protein